MAEQEGVHADVVVAVVNSRHAKEKKELIAKVTSMKHAVPKSDKKKTKEVRLQIEGLEKEMADRHARELKEATEALQKVSIEDTNEASPSETPVADGVPKKTRAQKQREKKAEADRRFAEAAKKDLKNAASGRGAKETSQITGQLEERGLRSVDVQPDGDCLYNALAQQLGLAEPSRPLSGAQVRREVAEFMLSHKEDFLPFLEDPSEEAFQSYCENVRNCSREGGRWGGALEISAFCKVFSRPVLVLHSDGQPHEFGAEFASKPLLVTFHRHAYSLGEHYNGTAPA